MWLEGSEFKEIKKLRDKGMENDSSTTMGHGGKLLYKDLKSFLKKGFIFKLF